MENKISLLRITLLLLISLLLLSLLTCSKAPNIFIGIVGNEDLEMNNTTVEVINASDVFFGMLEDKKFKLSKKHRFSFIHYNDKGNDELTLKHIRRLIEVDQVSAIIIVSEDTEILSKVSQYCSKKEVPLFSLTGYLDDDDCGEFSYELNDISHRGRQEMLDYVRIDEGIEDFVLVEYSNPQHPIDRPALPEDINLIDKFILTNSNLFEVVLDLKLLDEETGILFSGPVEKLQKFNYKIIEEGLTISNRLFFIDLMPQSDFTRDELNELTGCIFFSSIPSQFSSAEQDTLIEAFKTNSGEYPTHTQIMTYDILSAIALAIANVDSESHIEISKELVKMKPYDGIFGKIPPDDEKNRTPIYINKIDIIEESLKPIITTLKVIE